MKKSKTGRNEPCSCGSGRKYKKCCGSLSTSKLPPNIQKLIDQKNRETAALEKQRVQQQGLGRPIISTELDGGRVICVGNKIYFSPEWKTFHAFLSVYIKQLFGSNWGNNEISKPLENRHPLLKIYDCVVYRQQKVISQTAKINGIFSGDMTGAISLWYWLSYNLYLIEHNKKVQNRLITRLKHADQFAGAYYETFVAAIFLKTGFLIEFEDETQRTKSHCEFIATHQATGKKYGVEVKQRNRKSIISEGGSDNFKLDYKGMGSLLNDALKKESDHEKIIFIDVNLPSEMLKKYSHQNLQKKLVSFIDIKEHQFKSSPPAYVFFTNYPYHHEQDLDATNHYIFVLLDGFKIDDFGFKETTLLQKIASRENHKPINDLFVAIERYSNIPSTFDGSIDEFTYGTQQESRLMIGHNYIVRDKFNNDIVATLTHADVDTTNKKVYGLYCDAAGKTILAVSPISDSELRAYRKHPDTFFGVEQPQVQKLKTPIEAYDFFYENYQHAPRDIMLDFFEESSDYRVIEKLPRKELVKKYVEHHVYALIQNGWFKEGKGANHSRSR